MDRRWIRRFPQNGVLYAVASLCAAFFLIGCGGGGGSSGSGDSRRATITLYHSLTRENGQPSSVDSFINGNAFGTGTEYHSGLTRRDVRWNPSTPELFFRFSASEDTQRVLFRTALLLDSGAEYTLFLIGTTPASGPTKNAALLVFPRPDTPAPQGTFLVRFLNALPDAGPVDIYLSGGDKIVTAASRLTYPNLSGYFQITSAPDSPLRVRVVSAGEVPESAATRPLLDVLLPTGTDQVGHTFTQALTPETSNAASPPALFPIVER